jgi:hypothetical protein
MNEETRKVLEMVSQGKLTVQEAEQLLAAVETGARAEESKATPKYFRILVSKPAQDGKKAENVNIRVPMSVVRGGLRLGALFPGILGKKKIQLGNGVEFDLSNATYADLEAMIKDIGELSVHVDDDEGKQVRIRCE